MLQTSEYPLKIQYNQAYNRSKTTQRREKIMYLKFSWISLLGKTRFIPSLACINVFGTSILKIREREKK